MNFKELLLTDAGRLSRQPFWLGTILLCIAEGVVDLVLPLDAQASALKIAVSLVLSLLLLYPSICIGIKRFHDRDKSGWWVLIGLVPVIGWIWYAVETGFLRGTIGPNRFGSDPLAAPVPAAG